MIYYDLIIYVSNICEWILYSNLFKNIVNIQN